MGMREEVRKGNLSPEKAITTLQRGGGYSQSMMGWLTSNGRRRYEKGLEDQVRAEEAAKAKVKRDSK
jgi:hypothetical protein